MPGDLGQNIFSILEHQLVLEPDDCVSQFSKPLRTHFIIQRHHWICVWLSVQFYDQLLRSTVEVGNVIFYAMLPDEFSPLQLAVFKALPERSLSRCQVFTQCRPVIFKVI